MKKRYIRIFGDSYQCPSPNTDRLTKIFRDECRARGVLYDPDACFAWLMKFEDQQTGEQMSLF